MNIRCRNLTTRLNETILVMLLTLSLLNTECLHYLLYEQLCFIFNLLISFPLVRNIYLCVSSQSVPSGLDSDIMRVCVCTFVNFTYLELQKCVLTAYHLDSLYRTFFVFINKHYAC